MSGDFETMPIGTARRIEELENELTLLRAARPSLTSQIGEVAKTCRAQTEKLRAEILELEHLLNKARREVDEGARIFTLVRGHLERVGIRRDFVDDCAAAAAQEIEKLRAFRPSPTSQLGCTFCAFKADDLLGLKEHSAKCEGHPLFLRLKAVTETGQAAVRHAIEHGREATEARHQARVMRESMQHLHSTLSTCAGFKGVATREVWEALHDTFVAAAGRK